MSSSIIVPADKNPSPHANEEFRRVTDAFEILGNPTNRRRHDDKIHKEAQRRRKAREKERRQEEMQRQQNNRERKERQRRQREMVDKARATQSRIVKISDLEHFEKTMLDPSKKVYKTHCLMMFVSNKNAEKKGDEEIYFPYPFAGEAGNDNAYDSMLQIAKASLPSGFTLYWHNSLMTTALTRTFLFSGAIQHPNRSNSTLPLKVTKKHPPHNLRPKRERRGKLPNIPPQKTKCRCSW